MRIAILSFSSIVQRKILPALSRFNFSIAIDIYTRRPYDDLPKCINYTNLRIIFKPRSSYDSCDQDQYDFVYISSGNCHHLEDLQSSYRNNHHTIIDKPAFLSCADCLNIVSLFKASNLYLREAVVWHCHSQLRFFKHFIEKNSYLSAVSFFLIPELNDSNFRVQTFLRGSGVFHDMNAYAFSLAELLHIPYEQLVFQFPHDDLTNCHFFNAFYQSPKIMLSANFGFGFPYINSLLISSPSSSLSSDRIFTTSTDLSPSLCLSDSQGKLALEAFDDSFYNFLSSFIATLSVQPTPSEESYDDIVRKYSHPIFSYSS